MAVRGDSQDSVNLFCLDLKPQDTREKRKGRVLKAIRNAEKKTTPIPPISHPWREEAHALQELKGSEVLQVQACSDYIAFLLKDGRVCRMRVGSCGEKTPSRSLASHLKYFNQGPRGGEASGVLGDEEYARQLQAEFNSWNRNGPEELNQDRSFSEGASSSVMQEESSAALNSLMEAHRNPITLSMLEDNPLNSEWRSAISSLNSAFPVRGQSSLPFPEDIPDHSSRTTKKKGGAGGGASKGAKEKKKLKVKAWPEMEPLEWLVMKQHPDNPLDSSFVAMAAMHSEILLVSSKERSLYSWNCTGSYAPKPHPLSKELGLDGERICVLESTDVRATIVTESGKIATFYDQLFRVPPECRLPSLVQTLTHSAREFPELEGEKVAYLSMSNFMTCAVMQSGKVFWWGLSPPMKGDISHHTQLPESITMPTHYPAPFSNIPTNVPTRNLSSKATIVDGSLVRLRNGAPCGPNAIVFNEVGSQPRVGRTMNIIEHSGLDPKTSILVKVYKDKDWTGSDTTSSNSSTSLDSYDRERFKSDLEREIEYESLFSRLEVWSLSDAVFLDDSTAILGRVVTVDQLQAIVDISHATSETGTMDSTSRAQSTLKVFKLNEIESCMDSASSNTTPSHYGEGGGALGGVSSDDADKRSTKVRGVGMAMDGVTEMGKSTVSHHIAGLVQHRPICLLTPSAPLPCWNMPHPLSQDTDPASSESAPTTCIHGYYPLAVHMTDQGPIMLVRRISDNFAFLVCSGHTGFPSFSSSSFVSLSSRDSKPGRCTIEEEAVASLEGGFYGEGCNHGNVEYKDGMLMKAPHPSFLAIHKCHALLLQDLHGLICPMWDGLRLKPSPLFGQKRHGLPMKPYNAIATRVYKIKKETSVLLVIAVPKLQHLMPAVLSGDAAKAQSVLSKLTSPNMDEDSSPLLSTSDHMSHDQASNLSMSHDKESPKSHDHDGVSSDQSSEASLKRMGGVSMQVAPPPKKLRISGLQPTDFASEPHPLALVASSSEISVLAPKEEPDVTSFSLTDLDKLSFDAELPVLSKAESVESPKAESAESLVRSKIESVESPVRSKIESASCMDIDTVKSLSFETSSPSLLTPDILMEVTVDHSNILHVCGQLDNTTTSHTKKGSEPKSKSGKCNIEKEKSFEEMRYEVLQDGPHGYHNLSPQGVQNSSLSVRRLWILDCILENRDLDSSVTRLLCSRNRDGHTPFLSAICNQNYAAALKILRFAERTRSTFPSVFQQAILAPSSDSNSALHLLLASLVSSFDTTSMTLFVHNLQLNTGQRLLKLFQVRYPSAYKAEIFKKGEPEGNSGSEGESDSEGNDGEEAVGSGRNLFRGRFRRSHRRLYRRRGTTYNRDHLASSSVQTGIVYFSKMSELRAAAKEMQGFRIVSSAFRNTGFGSTQTISYLSVSLDQPSDSDDNFPDPDLPPRLNTGTMYDLLGPVLGVPVGPAPVVPKADKKKIVPYHKFSEPALAGELLRCLLDYDDLITFLDSAGETSLASVVHNPKCMDKIETLFPPPGRKKKTNSSSSLKAGRHGDQEGPCASTADNKKACASKPSHQEPKSGLGLLKQEYNFDSARHSSSPSPSAFPSPRLMPYVSLGEHVDLVVSQMTQGICHQGTLAPPDHTSQEMDTAPSPTQLEGVCGLGEGESGGSKFGNEASELVSLAIKNAFESALEAKNGALNRDGVLNGDTEEKSPSFPLPPVADDNYSEPLRFGKGTDEGTSSVNGSSGKNSPSGKGSSPVSGPSITLSCDSKMTSASSKIDTVKLLFSNWPSIVCTILGFNPPTSTTAATSGINPSPPRRPPSLVSVHLLDNFTTDFILNCSERIINFFVNSIIRKLNSAIKQDQDGKVSSLLLEDIDYADAEVISKFLAAGEEGVAILVARRFLGSVVRILALDHSRVKNKYLEMQQSRQSASASGMPEVIPADGSRRGRGTQNGSGPTAQADKDASISNVAISIISHFSWLAVHALSQSAEACSAPIRLGISKPLGASSVIAEYQTTPRGYSGSAYTSLTPGNRQSSGAGQRETLMRQLHVRAARIGNVPPFKASPLPTEGLFLRPQAHSIRPNPLGASAAMGAGPGIHPGCHDDSSDEELQHNMEVGPAGNNMDDPAHIYSAMPMGSLQFPLESTAASYASQIHGEVFLDLDSTSSSEDQYPPRHVLFEWGAEEVEPGRVGVDNDNLGSIYTHAWALDGRRIGENGQAMSGRADSPNSITAPITFNSSHEPPVPLANIPSIRFGAGFLARTFARFVKDLVDLSHKISDNQLPEVSLAVPVALQHQLVSRTVQSLEKTWRWAVCVLDKAEGQILRGQNFDVQRHVVSLRGGNGHSLPNTRPVHVRASRSFVGSTPGEYVSSLLRTINREDKECLPVLDLYGYEHVVYVLDSFLYTLVHWPNHLIPAVLADQSGPQPPLGGSGHTPPDHPHKRNEDSPNKTKKTESAFLVPGPSTSNTDQSTSQSCFKFFKRSDSVSLSEEQDSNTQMSNYKFFGGEGGASLALENPQHVGPPSQWGKRVDSFSRPLEDDYPLANQPHLLKPFARKEALFGGMETNLSSYKGDNVAGKGKKGKKRKNLSGDEDSSSLAMMWSADHAYQRWHSSINVFAHIFLAEGPGNERSNFLNARAGFASRMARFRHQVTQLYDASHIARDWAGAVSSTLSLRIRRDRLIMDSLHSLQQMVHFHYSNIRVKFDGEDGSGPGVNRGFFASLANELKSGDINKTPLNRLGLLFHEPGKKPEQGGMFAPHPFMPHLTNTTERININRGQRKDAFLAIGRFLGLCLWFHYTIPFMVCRHVAKVLLGRPLAWHDLAFYNADLYEGLRQMMLDAEVGKKDEEEFISTYCLFFEAPLPGKCLEPEPVLVELIPGGSKIPVTAGRVQEYVRLYSMMLMVECIEDELSSLKQGLNDIIPEDLLSGLTAEDFQLLLSGGSADITIQRLKSIIRFNHTHGNSRTVCDRFEKMFWRIVSHMTNTQRQQLLYFATGSAALPASVDSSARMTSVAITLDVIGSRNTDSLPVASTCSQRMCIPLYPSYRILKKKLFQAIQCQAYGLG